jgi:hypothetical protein
MMVFWNGSAMRLITKRVLILAQAVEKNPHRVENLDKNDDQKNPIGKHHDVFGQLSPRHDWIK